MFGTMKSGASAYAKVGVETGVMAASPHTLIVMLFDGAVTAVRSALVHMKSGNIAEKGKAVSKAIQIIENGLRASLDKKAGGQIGENLDALYEYMQQRLLVANLQNQPEILEEVAGLLNELREAWNAIGVPGGTPVNAPASAPVAAFAGA
ncbi:flagellar export chaperone FliS [Massilia yuzhufengensis]|uniref:Flagellar secretion chaperone FliS n=1 Tax=Massilia yuzhufengensis TaxID=1164594 RepID=A0A1I1MMM0_9BURK|nr:flagellar export chaperone FliS [Massilia yuzhufengensis]SFC86385.1 flagellar protein FliS [Massilia yuzhufengensis]